MALEHSMESKTHEALIYGGKDPLGYCRRAKEGCNESERAGWDRVHDNLKQCIEKQGMQVPYSSVSEVPTTPAK